MIDFNLPAQITHHPRLCGTCVQKNAQRTNLLFPYTSAAQTLKSLRGGYCRCETMRRFFSSTSIAKLCQTLPIAFCFLLTWLGGEFGCICARVITGRRCMIWTRYTAWKIGSYFTPILSSAPGCFPLPLFHLDLILRYGNKSYHTTKRHKLDCWIP